MHGVSQQVCSHASLWLLRESSVQSPWTCFALSRINCSYSRWCSLPAVVPGCLQAQQHPQPEPREGSGHPWGHQGGRKAVSGADGIFRGNPVEAHPRGLPGAWLGLLALASALHCAPLTGMGTFLETHEIVWPP